MSHPENELNNILSQLRREHRAIDAPSSLKDRLVRQTRQAHARTSQNSSWLRSHAWGLSFALLAITAAVAGWLLIHTPARPSQQGHIQPAPVPTSTLQTANAPQPAETRPTPQTQSPRQLTAQSARRPRRPNPPAAATQDATAEGRFVRLPASEGLPEPMQPSFVRTRILTSSLPQYGIDVPPFAPPQSVLAEFVVGEDGLPRAIRLIR
jgi:hypothetical protein